MVKYVTDHWSVELCTLLDEVFGRVFYKTQEGKRFMSKQEGKDAQLMAISFTNAVRSALPLKKSKTNTVEGDPQYAFALRKLGG